MLIARKFNRIFRNEDVKILKNLTLQIYTKIPFKCRKLFLLQSVGFKKVTTNQNIA